MILMHRTALVPIAILAFALFIALTLAAQAPTPFTPGMVVTG